MEKRYQVFVSSTFQDLQEERTEVIQALLELDCFPAAMELFPAANDEQWEWIKKIIDDSDYYVVIVAGKYGSISEKTGLSYTRMEYQYAIESGKPVIGFLYENSENLPANKYETDPDRREKLEEFKEIIKSKLCKFWSNPSDLGAKVSRSLTQLINRYPATGWVRADFSRDALNQEMLDLRRKNDELENQIKKIDHTNDIILPETAFGSDEVKIRFKCKALDRMDNLGSKPLYTEHGFRFGEIAISFDNILIAISDLLLTYQQIHMMVEKITDFVKREESEIMFEIIQPHDTYGSFELVYEDVKRILLHLKLIKILEYDEEYSNWTLTSLGMKEMSRAVVLKRDF
jgi:hypothetical protein